MASGNSYAAGLVAAGSGTHSNQFLRKDGTWVVPENDNTTYSAGSLLDLSTTTFNVDLTELTDGTADVVGSEDELVYLDDSVQKRKLISDMYSLMVDEGDEYQLDQSGLGKISSKSFITYNDISLIKRASDSGHTEEYNLIKDIQHVSEGAPSYIYRGTEEIVAEVFSHLTSDKYGLSSIKYPELSELFRNAYGKDLIPEYNLDNKFKGASQKGFFEKISDYFFSFFSSGGSLAKGGMLSGPSHSRGGIKGFIQGHPVEMEGGEYVISKDAVDKYGIDIFDTLNLQKFEPGGFAGTYSGGYSGPTKIGPIGDLLSKEDLERILEKASKATSGDPRIIQSTKKALTIVYGDLFH